MFPALVSGDNFDLIVMDVRLPKISGIDLQPFERLIGDSPVDSATSSETKIH